MSIGDSVSPARISAEQLARHQQELDALAANRFVASVAPVLRVATADHSTAGECTAADATAELQRIAEMVGATRVARALDASERRIVVAQIDSGVMSAHPLLSGSIVSMHDVHGQPDAEPWLVDGRPEGHGTAVAATIAAMAGAGSPQGAFRGFGLVPIRVTRANGSITADDVVAAVKWVADNAATHNIVVMNVSMQIPDAILGPGVRLHTELANQLARVEAAGVVTIAAAGNNGIFQNDPDGPGIDLDALDLVGRPVSRLYFPHAPIRAMVVVAATGNGNLRWHGSNFGRVSVDIAAPGEKRHLPIPILSQTAGTLGFASGCTVRSGTSFSVPIVAGVAALLRAHHPAATALEISEALSRGVVRHNGMHAELASGGISDAGQALQELGLLGGTEPAFLRANRSMPGPTLAGAELPTPASIDLRALQEAVSSASRRRVLFHSPDFDTREFSINSQPGINVFDVLKNACRATPCQIQRIDPPAVGDTERATTARIVGPNIGSRTGELDRLRDSLAATPGLAITPPRPSFRMPF